MRRLKTDRRPAAESHGSGLPALQDLLADLEQRGDSGGGEQQQQAQQAAAKPKENRVEARRAALRAERQTKAADKKRVSEAPLAERTARRNAQATTAAGAGRPFRFDKRFAGSGPQRVMGPHAKPRK